MHGHLILSIFILSILESNGLLQPQLRGHKYRSSVKTVSAPRTTHQPSALAVFFADHSDEAFLTNSFNRRKYTPFSNGGIDPDNVNLLDLKDDALSKVQTEVSSRDNNLGIMQQQQQLLQRKLNQLENGLKITTEELISTRDELETTIWALEKSIDARDGLEWSLGQSQEEAKRVAARVEYLESYLAGLGIDISSVASPIHSKKKKDSNPWDIWKSTSKSFIPVPLINDWVVIKSSVEGQVQISGKITNHQSIPDGDAIVTSPLSDPSQAFEKSIVTTMSGSRYKLGVPLAMPYAKPLSKRLSPQQSSADGTNIGPSDLTGYTIGNGRYLLAGSSTSSGNGRSLIQTAYRASPSGKPIGELLAIKISSNKEAMKREYNNYQKLASALKRGGFIKRVEFLPVAGQEMPEKSALVMQRGISDVKAFMPTVGGRLEGEMLYDCAMTALLCVEALHAAKLVWNDLKTENFVAVEIAGKISFRGIDLESCMPVRTNPVDYTPEACPPEFAKAFIDGDAESFLLEYSYDVWSFGMFLYEICTGRGFFDGLSADKITKMLLSFEPDMQDVPDPQLADVISQCLNNDPKCRPSFVRISRHAYFLGNSSSNISPLHFLLR